VRRQAGRQARAHTQAGRQAHTYTHTHTHTHTHKHTHTHTHTHKLRAGTRTDIRGNQLLAHAGLNLSTGCRMNEAGGFQNQHECQMTRRPPVTGNVHKISASQGKRSSAGPRLTRQRGACAHTNTREADIKALVKMAECTARRAAASPIQNEKAVSASWKTTIRLSKHCLHRNKGHVVHSSTCGSLSSIFMRCVFQAFEHNKSTCQCICVVVCICICTCTGTGRCPILLDTGSYIFRSDCNIRKWHRRGDL